MAQTLLSVSALLLSVALFIFGHGLQTTLLPLAADRFYFSDFRNRCDVLGLFRRHGARLPGRAADHHARRAHPCLCRAGFPDVGGRDHASGDYRPLCLVHHPDDFRFLPCRVLHDRRKLAERERHQRKPRHIMSIYIVILFGALMTGQISIATMSISSFVPFVIASVSVSLP